MKILGLDPGTATTGFAIIQKQLNLLQVIKYGIIKTTPDKKDSLRLVELGNDLTEIIKKYSPNRVGIEKLYFETNQKTAMTVSQSRGVCLYILEQHNIPIFEYTPLQVKNFTTGFGKADKKQIQNAIKKIFKLEKIPKPDDAADALAIAYRTSFDKSTPA